MAALEAELHTENGSRGLVLDGPVQERIVQGTRICEAITVNGVK
jgi:hypothetical protein